MARPMVRKRGRGRERKCHGGTDLIRARCQSSRVIVLGPNAALRMRQGALTIEHGEDAARIKHKLDIDDPPPCAILFDGRGEFLTGDAIRFCVERGIILVLPDGPGRMITMTHSAIEATE